MSGGDEKNRRNDRKEKEAEPGFGEILAGAAFAGLLGIGLYTAGNLLFGAPKTSEKSLSPKRDELMTDNVPVMEKLKKAFLKRDSEFKSASDEPTMFA